MLISHRPNEVPEIDDVPPPNMKHLLGMPKKNIVDNIGGARQKREMKCDRGHKLGHHNKSLDNTNID